MCDTNSKAYHDAEQEAFTQIQAEDEAALNHEIAEYMLLEYAVKTQHCPEATIRQIKANMLRDGTSKKETCERLMKQMRPLTDFM
jgi:hypothetical protein